jgi:TonB family protein
MVGALMPRRLEQFGSWVLALTTLLLPNSAPSAHAQVKLIGYDEIAQHIATQLENADAKKIIVIDLAGPDGKRNALGCWLADQFASALARASQRFTLLDPAPVREAIEGAELKSPTSVLYGGELAKLAQRAGADGFVTGSYAAARSGLGVTLVATQITKKNEKKELPSTMGKLPLTPELESHLGAPLDSLRPSGGIYVSMAGGVGVAECKRCPPPSYTREARRNHIEGTIVLEVVVTAEGNAGEIKLLHGLEADLDAQVIATVRRWTFFPAKDADGRAVSVRPLVEINMRLALSP